MQPASHNANAIALRPANAPAYRFAPYVDIGSYPPPSLTSYAAAIGNYYYVMAFMQAYEGKKCEAAWYGSVLPSDPANGKYFADQVNGIRAAGGDAILSFGGAAGTDIADVCTTPATLASAYEAAIDYYKFTHVDFDIEGNNPYDSASIARRTQALVMVQRHYVAKGAPLVISYTLPVLPSGLPPHVRGVVKSAVLAHLTLAIVNVMTMDYGDSSYPNPQGKMGTYAIAAAVATVNQLKSIGFPLGKNPYGSIGVTPDIGVNDVPDEIFELSDASQLVQWGRNHGIGRLSFWAQQRDQECNGGVKHTSYDTCSSILQAKYAFAKIFVTL